MKTIPFDEDRDLAPMPFNDRICRQALELKRIGLNWHPHVGCFVWDVDNAIQVDSPFPGNIYFILSLPRFIEIFGSIDHIVNKLVWLPTWHQARILCQQLGIPDEDIAGCLQSGGRLSAADELEQLYERIAATLRQR
jgi:hypothetical protein